VAAPSAAGASTGGEACRPGEVARARRRATVQGLLRVGLQETDDEDRYQPDDGDQKQGALDKQAKWHVVSARLMRHSPFLAVESRFQ